MADLKAETSGKAVQCLNYHMEQVFIVYIYEKSLFCNIFNKTTGLLRLVVLGWTMVSG